MRKKISTQQAPIKVVLLENIHEGAKRLLEEVGFRVTLLPDSPRGSDLDLALRGARVLGIRSKTQISREILDQSLDIDLIGCFCIGTDQVELQAAREKGIPVFNAPHSNTRSVAELVMAEIIALSRKLGDRNTKAHQGEWTKSADGAHEVRGKTLGIVGYGHIGSQVSVLAEAFGLHVIFYDVYKKLPLGNSKAVSSFEDLLRESDFVSFHVPDSPATRGMMGASEIKIMKPGAALINASRGTVVDIEALAVAIKEKRLMGAAIDVFPEEPASNKLKFSSPLQGLPNVILTPHIGGSTLEAQEAIGQEVAASIISFYERGVTAGAVNFPTLDMPLQHKGSYRITNAHVNTPGVLGDINSLISDFGANIQAQGLATDQSIGYLVTDIAVGSDKIAELVERVAGLKTSLKTRLIAPN